MSIPVETKNLGPDDLVKIIRGGYADSEEALRRLSAMAHGNPRVQELINSIDAEVGAGALTIPWTTEAVPAQRGGWLAGFFRLFTKEDSYIPPDRDPM